MPHLSLLASLWKALDCRLISYIPMGWRSGAYRASGILADSAKRINPQSLEACQYFDRPRKDYIGTILGINYSVERLCNRCVYLASFIVTSSNIRSRSHDSAQGLPRRTRLKGEYRDAPPLQFMMRILTDSGALYLVTAIAHFVVCFTPNSFVISDMVRTTAMWIIWIQLLSGL